MNAESFYASNKGQFICSSPSKLSFFPFKATAVYQAKEKLASIEKAKKGEPTHLSLSLRVWTNQLTVDVVSGDI